MSEVEETVSNGDVNPLANNSTKANVTPWSANSKNDTGIDYDKLLNDSESSNIDNELLSRFEKITGQKPHYLLRRGIVDSHKDMHTILDLYEKGKPFYLYINIEPSSPSMHLGHLIQLKFCKHLQEVFHVPLIIELSDHKGIIQKNLSIEEAVKLSYANAKDVIACGFFWDKTYLFSNLEHVGQNPAYYKNMLRICQYVINNKMNPAFNFIGTDLGGGIVSATLATSVISSTFPFIFNKSVVPCLIPCAMDRDPHYTLSRFIATKLNYPKPALMHFMFLPGLQGTKTKMSASDDNSAIFLTDTPKQIKTKINKYAFSGGQATIEEHRELGENCEVDVAYQYLRYFLEDDNRLEEIKKGYTSGEILTDELKKESIQILEKIIDMHKEVRSKITDDCVEFFMRPRKLNYIQF